MCHITGFPGQISQRHNLAWPEVISFHPYNPQIVLMSFAFKPFWYNFENGTRENVDEGLLPSMSQLVLYEWSPLGCKDISIHLLDPWCHLNCYWEQQVGPVQTFNVERTGNCTLKICISPSWEHHELSEFQYFYLKVELVTDKLNLVIYLCL